MRRYPPGFGSGVIALAIIQHYTWAICLAVDPQAINVTALLGIKTLVAWSDGQPGWVGGDLVGVISILCAVASIAVWAFVTPLPYTRLVMMLPQQLVLLISAIGAIYSMYHGMFADGTVRTSAFLIVDQLPVVLLAVFHAIGVYQTAFNWRVKDWGPPL